MADLKARIAVCLALAAIVGCTSGTRATARTPAGKVQEYQVPSKHQGKNRRVWVYTPPGYDAARDTSLGMVLVFDGGQYLEDIPLPRVLDSLLAAGVVPPMIAVLLDDGSGSMRLDDLANRGWFVGFIGDELVPWARSRWHVSRDPRRSLITGSSAGGLAALHIALRRPELFGNVFSQSGAFWRGSEASNGPPYQWLASQVGRWPRGEVRVRLEVGSEETGGTLGGQAPSILSANRALRDTLQAKGYDVTYFEVPKGVHSPESWAKQFPTGIAAAMAHR